MNDSDREVPKSPDSHGFPHAGRRLLRFHQLCRVRYMRWAEAHLGSRADAEEAVDSAFEQLAIDWVHVLRQPVPEAYAWRVVKNRTIDAARGRSRRPSVVDVATFETRALHWAVDPIGELEESLSIYQAINQLPERQFDVIVLRYCLGYDTSETADVMGITVAGVRSTARYAKRRLKQSLGLDEDERRLDEPVAD
ncbi:RNA polymerase sigma factor [Streptomyces sp. NPDC091292]|uniref:RNA polymerase sigma factor n=1 Tax=Streptomyces sp. NPDC091292 TaxID=3365991 RepID=UPI0038068A41